MGEPAFAVPSFARQTGQARVGRHIAFPELTPFGRRFKLMGCTMQGGDRLRPAECATAPRAQASRPAMSTAFQNASTA
jgi:hypothetical protein